MLIQTRIKGVYKVLLGTDLLAVSLRFHLEVVVEFFLPVLSLFLLPLQLAQLPLNLQ